MTDTETAGAEQDSAGVNKQVSPDPVTDPVVGQVTELSDLLAHCPTPGVCFPYGLPVDAHHVACVHGESFAE